MDKKLGDDRTSQIEAAETFGAEELFRMLWRRKFVVIGTVVAMMLALALFLTSAVPLYTAQLRILFESKAGSIFDAQAGPNGQPQDDMAILSEIEVLRSRRLAERVIDKLQLDQDAEFKPLLRPKGWAEFVDKNITDFMRQPVLTVTSEADEKLQQKEIIVDRFLDRVKASQIPNTRTINVSFTSSRPDTAATVLNTLGEMYLTARLEDRFENMKRSSEWLGARMETLRQRVAESEREVEEYRQRNNLFEGERSSLVAQQISDLNAKLMDARAARTTAEVNLTLARRLAQSPASADTATQVLSSDLIRRFREEELDLERREAESGAKYGPRHPSMIQLQAEKRRLTDKLREEIRKIAVNLENELLSARSREAALNRDLQALKSELAQSNQASIGLHSLQRDAEANRLLLEKFLASFTQTNAQDGADSQVSDARIISSAPTPKAPSYPLYVPFIAVGLLVSTLVGVALVMMVEYLDASFRSAEQVERETGRAVLALVPLVLSSHLRGSPFARYVLDRPHSAFAESIRSVYNYLSVAERDSAAFLLDQERRIDRGGGVVEGDHQIERRGAEVILFTSSQVEEGKSVVAWGLAQQVADSGQRVVLLDTDCHSSSIANMAGIEHSPGLSDVLEGKCTIDAATQEVPDSTLRVVVAGQLPRKSVWLDRIRLAAIINDLRAENDLVVIDSPPVLAVTDPNVVATLCDAVVLLVRWGVTRRRVVAYALNQLSKVGAHVHGIVVSMVDVRKHAHYGYGDSGYYYGKSRKYYSSDR